MNENKKIAVIGERPNRLGGYRDERTYDTVKSMLAWAIAKMHRELGADGVTSTGAQGAGQIAYAAAVEAREQAGELTIDVTAPFEGQQRLWDEDSLYGKRSYLKMRVALENDPMGSFTELTSREELKKTTITAACHECNRKLVDEAAALLVVWNREEELFESDPTSSTIAEAAHRALSQKKPVAVLDWRACELCFYDKDGNRVEGY